MLPPPPVPDYVSDVCLYVEGPRFTVIWQDAQGFHERRSDDWGQTFGPDLYQGAGMVLILG